MHDGIAGVACHEQDLESGPELSCLLSELPAVHAAHDDVGQHHVNADCGMVQKARAAARSGRRDDMITEIAQRLDHIAPQKVAITRIDSPHSAASRGPSSW